ncbi:MAG: hypothetical protein AB1797_04115 [bacterium]
MKFLLDQDVYTITPQHLRCARECYMRLDARSSMLDTGYSILDTGSFTRIKHRASSSEDRGSRFIERI